MNSRRFHASYGDDGTLVYDLEQLCVVRDLSDFSLHLLSSCVQASPITERIRMEHLVEFRCHFATLPPHELSDHFLEHFRNAQYEKVLVRAQSIGSKGAAKETVNGKLVSVYKWLEWMQEGGRIPKNTIGAIDCRVTAYPRASASRGAHASSSGGRYPLLYRRTGQGSKHRASLALTATQLEMVSEHLVEKRSEYVGMRDALVLDIAVETGMRRASINSLRASMFERSALVSQRGTTFSICPAIQKFNYEDDINFPVELGLRVLAFIEGPREDLLGAKSKFAKNAGDRIFLSARNCSPMTDRALSQSLSAIMRAVGIGKGVALHAGRRAFATNRIQTETDRRVELGLDTSTASIAAAVSIEMGQRNPNSLFPYVAREQSRRALATVAETGLKKEGSK